MNKKEKIFYLDFIRVISMLMIVTYHFFAHFPENNIVGTDFIFSNGRWGLIGVTLFFMISGASLMYNYREKLEIKTYFKKRFLGIYPMFWIAYTALFLYLFYLNKQNFWVIPSYRIVFSVFAMDGYLASYLRTIYLLGEWFLGCIILIYIIFPLIRKAVINYPKLTLSLATIINLLVLLFHTNGIMPINQNIIPALYSFILGMYIIKIKEINWWYALIGLLVFIIGFLPPTITMNRQVLISNISAYYLFFFLAFIGQKINNNIVKKSFITISKYCYAIFLVHHYLIIKIESVFQNHVYGIIETLILYLIVWSVIALFSKILYTLNTQVIGFFKKENNKKIKE